MKISFSLVCFLSIFLVELASGQQQVQKETKSQLSVPVVFNEDTLYFIRENLGPYTPKERAHAVTSRLQDLANDRSFNKDSLIIESHEHSVNIKYKGRIITTITEQDARHFEESILETTNDIHSVILQEVVEGSGIVKIWRTIKEMGLTLLVILVSLFLIKYVNKLFRYLKIKIVTHRDRFIKGIKFRNYEFLEADRELELILWIVNVFKWLMIIVIFYAALPILFSIFPATEGIADALFGYIWRPLKSLFIALFNYLPNMIAIVVILFVTYYLIKFLKFISSEIQHEKLVIPGFYPDWARPTFNIFRFLLYAFALVLIFPYLPGSNSPVFQGVSVFLGLLISLGSSSAISNLIAGLVITYMRAFKVGDRVKIGETVGDVLEKTALVTRVRTIKNETITIPNSAILNGHTINYSASLKRFELILHTTITIGYDVPWKQVHELLIEAAGKTEGLLKKPAPFVLQTSLDDYYVSYQINAYTDRPKNAARIYSEIHQHIQDLFNANGIEIMSPHYRANRDGNHVTIPSSYLPPDYKAPSFQVNQTKED